MQDGRGKSGSQLTKMIMILFKKWKKIKRCDTLRHLHVLLWHCKEMNKEEKAHWTDSDVLFLCLKEGERD